MPFLTCHSFLKEVFTVLLLCVSWKYWERDFICRMKATLKLMCSHSKFESYTSSFELAKIYKTQQNSRCSLCGYRDETINLIRSERSKLSRKEYKTRHDWVGNVIYWELCKKMKFDYTNKWYMQNPESILVSEMHQPFWDFEIQTGIQISARRPDLKIINQNDRNCRIVNFAVLDEHRVKLKECEKRDKYVDLARELKKLWNMKVQSPRDWNKDWRTWK